MSIHEYILPDHCSVHSIARGTRILIECGTYETGEESAVDPLTVLYACQFHAQSALAT